MEAEVKENYGGGEMFQGNKLSRPVTSKRSEEEVFTLLAWLTSLLLYHKDYYVHPVFHFLSGNFLLFYHWSIHLYILFLVHSSLYNKEQQKDTIEGTAHHLEILYFVLTVLDLIYGKKDANGYLVSRRQDIG